MLVARSRKLALAMRLVSKQTYMQMRQIAVDWFSKFNVTKMKSDMAISYFKAYYITIKLTGPLIVTYEREHPDNDQYIRRHQMQYITVTENNIYYSASKSCNNCSRKSIILKHIDRKYYCINCGCCCMNRNCDLYRLKTYENIDNCLECGDALHEYDIGFVSDSYYTQHLGPSNNSCVWIDGSIATHACNDCRNSRNQQNCDMIFN